MTRFACLFCACMLAMTCAAQSATIRAEFVVTSVGQNSLGKSVGDEISLVIQTDESWPNFDVIGGDILFRSAVERLAFDFFTEEDPFSIDFQILPGGLPIIPDQISFELFRSEAVMGRDVYALYDLLDFGSSRGGVFAADDLFDPSSWDVFYTFDLVPGSVTAVPLPAGILLLFGGLTALAALRMPGRPYP